MWRRRILLSLAFLIVSLVCFVFAAIVTFFIYGDGMNRRTTPLGLLFMIVLWTVPVLFLVLSLTALIGLWPKV